MEGSRVKFVENRLILGQFHSTLLPLNPNRSLKIVGWQLLLEDACKVRGVHRRGPALSGKIGKEERC